MLHKKIMHIKKNYAHKKITHQKIISQNQFSHYMQKNKFAKTTHEVINENRKTISFWKSKNCWIFCIFRISGTGNF